jgi:hypothetical protein
VELSLAPSWNRSGRGEFERLAEGGLAVAAVALGLGVGDDADVRAVLAYATAYDAAWSGGAGEAGPGRPVRSHGLADAVVGGRVRCLRSERHALDVAVVANVVLPVGRRGSADAVELTQGFWSVDAAVVASKDLGPLTANVEAGFLLPVGAARGDDRGVAFGNVAWGVQLLPWLQPVLELGYQYALEAAPDDDAQLLTVTAGLIMPLEGGYRLGAGLRHAAWGRGVGQSTGATLAFSSAF